MKDDSNHSARKGRLKPRPSAEPLFTKKNMYLNNRVLSWKVEIQSWSEVDEQVKSRAEQLLLRSELHLYTDKSKDSRADCLVTLKRALNHRLKAIEENYEFKKISLPNKPKSYLELLEVLGIVRPLLLKKLLKIRNEIEHEDADPPSYNQCKEYVDVVWYFLKSTNKYVTMASDDIILKKLKANGLETQYWINLNIEDKQFTRINIIGWLPKSYLKSKTKKADYLSLVINEIHTKRERWTDNKDHKDKLPTDTWINGSVVLTDAQRLKLLRQILEIL